MSPTPPETASSALPSLQQRIGRHVLLSLLSIWALGSLVFMSVADHFVAEAFDRALLDDAHALATHVRSDGAGGLRLDLTNGETELLRFDPAEPIRFAVYGADGQRISGDPDLPPATVPAGSAHAVSTVDVASRPLRRVSLRIDGPPAFTVHVAQTTNSRTQLLRRLLVYSGLVQLWLLVVLGFWLLRRIERDLRPLSELQDAVAQRDAADLRPLSLTLEQPADTRDVARLAEALDSLLRRMQDSLLAQREFAGTVAHELRTPLAGIRAQAAHALSQTDPSVWQHELQGIAQTELRASRTVDQLLALARAIEGGIALAVEPLALDERVRELLLRHLPKADAAGVDLGAEGLDQTVTVTGHAGLIEGILNNLLDNALRYGTAPEPRITVSLHCEEHHALLCVTDNGPGLDSLPPAQLRQRWVQGVAGRQRGQGMGLGLSIVARYAELMGGRLDLAQAADGRGLQACVRLPLATATKSGGAAA